MVEVLLSRGITGCNCNCLPIPGKKDRNCIQHFIAGWQAPFERLLVRLRAIVQDRATSVVNGSGQGKEHYEGAKLRVGVFAVKIHIGWCITCRHYWYEDGWLVNCR